MEKYIKLQAFQSVALCMMFLAHSLNFPLMMLIFGKRGDVLHLPCLVAPLISQPVTEVAKAFMKQVILRQNRVFI